MIHSKGGVLMRTIPAKTILTRTKDATWFGAGYNMNLYRGCCHGCIYCDSRSACYGVEDFETVRAKENALSLLRDELSRKARADVVSLGSMSDPYNPFEQHEQLTRHALELLAAYGFGVMIATKGSLVTRDADVLREAAAQQPVIVALTVTTCDDALAAKLEPHAPPPSARLEALRQLSAAGLFTGVLLMPVLPFLEDSAENVGAVVRAAGRAGARFVYPMLGLTMRQGQREHFYACLDESFPGLSQKYRARYGERYVCRAPGIKALGAAFLQACGEFGLLGRMSEIVAASRQGYDRQLSFL